MRRILITAAIGALLFGLLAPTPAGAGHSWGGYHWARTSNPFTVRLLDSMTPGWDPYLKGSVSGIPGNVSADWTSSTVLDTPAVNADASKNTRKRCQAPTGAVRVCNASYGRNGWLGIAEIWLRDGHIAKARARVNDTYFSRSPYNNVAAKRHVLCQEVGHVLGLDHQTATSCMDDENGLFDTAYARPNSHDYQQLVTIYGGHADAAAATSSGPGNGRGGTDVVVTREGPFVRVAWIFRAD